MTLCYFRGACPGYCDPPHSAYEGVRRGSVNGDVRVFPRVQRSKSDGSASSTLVIAGYEWVRDDVLKYKSCLTLATSVVGLQCQVKLANLKDSCKLAAQARGSNDFSVFRAAPGCPPFFFMYLSLIHI